MPPHPPPADRAELAHIDLLEESLEAALVTRPDGTILYANRAACDLFGYTADELRTLGRAAVVDPTDPRLADGLRIRSATGRFRGVITMVTKSGRRFPVEISSAIYRIPSGEERTSMFVRDLTEQQAREDALRASNAELQTALDEVRTLRGLLPICSYCKSIRDRNDYWLRLEEYLAAHAPVDFSHGICPTCARKHFGIAVAPEG